MQPRLLDDLQLVGVEQLVVRELEGADRPRRRDVHRVDQPAVLGEPVGTREQGGVPPQRRDHVAGEGGRRVEALGRVLREELDPGPAARRGQRRAHQPELGSVRRW